jgi:cobalt-precorrin-5B (C1)-methyltransferase
MMGAAGPLRRGWTTGACATAATKAAYVALVTGHFPDPVTISLPVGISVAFALATQELRADGAVAGIIKDAGDDPDVTHGALIVATVRRSTPGSSVTFRAGPGVGTVTKPGLVLAVGEPAINPVPRRMMRETITTTARELGDQPDVLVEISVPDGERIARRTMNGRLGIIGGLSILGTTGVVVPYSCSAWVASIRQGIDVARALSLDHIVGATGATSEAAAARVLGVSESALIDMGDFVGGMLRYIHRHPIPRVTIAGGFAKMVKLAQGHLDLHSRRCRVDLTALASLAGTIDGSPEVVDRIARANTALEALHLADSERLPLAETIARLARATGATALATPSVALGVLVVDRDGVPLAHVH